MKADGEDLAFVVISAFDKDGYPVENARNRIHVEVEGAGRLLGLDNGAFVHVHVSHADPTLIGLAPAVADFQDLNLVTLDIAANLLGGVGAGLADVQSISADNTGAGSACGEGAVHLDISHADPALAGVTTAANLSEDLNGIIGLIRTNGIEILAGAGTDVQTGACDSAGTCACAGGAFQREV